MITSLKLLKKQYATSINNFSNNSNSKLTNLDLQFAFTSECFDKCLAIARDLKFNTKAEEVDYFKNYKSFFLSKLYYYSSLVEIESLLSLQNKEGKEKVIRYEFDKILKHQRQHSKFYSYVLTDSQSEDLRYFSSQATTMGDLIDRPSINLNLSATHEQLYARILSNKEISVYLDHDAVGSKPSTSNNYNAFLKWTGTKVQLSELSKALVCSGILNNGEAKLKDIYEGLCNLFQIDSSISANTYRKMKERSNSKSFLDFLKSS